MAACELGARQRQNAVDFGFSPRVPTPLHTDVGCASIILLLSMIPPAPTIETKQGQAERSAERCESLSAAGLLSMPLP